MTAKLTNPRQWRLFEDRWRDKCSQPCPGPCDCRHWAITRSWWPYTNKVPR